MKRRSAISPKSFLDTAFFLNQSNSPSLSEYSIGLSQRGITASKQAIDKRFNENTKTMLSKLLEQVISHQLLAKNKRAVHKKWFTDIHIMDSSEFAVSKRAAEVFPGYGGEGRESLVQIQFEYQLLAGKVTTLSIGSALDSDSVEGMKNLDGIPPKTLLLRDLGYCSPKAFKELSQRDLYFISRAKSQWNFYILQDGKYHLLTTSDIINKLNQTQGKYIDLDVFVGEQARTPVRLIANLLTEEQKKRRLKKKSANRKLGHNVLESIGLNLFVTNVERENCAASGIYELYTLRWQVELVFKTWKSVMQVHRIHSMNPIRLECIILIKLLWVMLNWSIVYYLKRITGLDLSYHKVTRTISSSSKRISGVILKQSELFADWLIDLCQISERHHLKEYKKGSKSIATILLQATAKCS